MAVTSIASEPAAKEACRRCLVEESDIIIRNEPLCKNCFENYVRSKVVKRMETFRVRHATHDKPRTLLLPLSFGAGSMALLHILSNYLKGQVARTGRTGFALRVLHISSSEAEPVLLNTIKARYPEHYYAAIPLSDAVTLNSVSDLFPPTTATESTDEHLTRLLDTTSTATSRADLLTMLQTKLIVSHAKSHECECIIWGHCTTRLAEQILAETAKGRGFAMHLISAEGASTHGVPSHYPCRDLLNSETTSYGSMIEPPLPYVEEKLSTTVSSKHVTIDSLMQQYFASVEKDHPSIVANVVRTAAKLQGDALSQVEQQCELCEMPLHGNAPQMSRVCNACIRIMPV